MSTSDFICGGIMPVPFGYNGTTGYECSQCDRACSEKKDFFKHCSLLQQSDLEPKEGDGE